MKFLLLAPAGLTTAHGVVDQAAALVQGLQRDGHIAKLRIVIGPRSDIPPASSAERLPLRRAFQRIDDDVDVVWMHYSNYGLSLVPRLGVPHRFEKDLARWRRRHSRVRLLVSVHEGWDQPQSNSLALAARAVAQRHVVRRVCATANGIVINCDRWSQLAEQSSSMVLIETPSNFPPRPSAPDRVRTGAVVMGGVTQRRAILAQLHTNGLDGIRPDELIHDVGGGDCGVRAVGRSEVVRHGFVTAAVMTDILSDSRIGVVDIPPDVMGKSTAVAAFRESGLSLLNLATGKLEGPRDGDRSNMRQLLNWATSDQF